MSKEEVKESQLKVAVISIALTFILTSIGTYFTYEFIESKKSQDKFVFENRKNLYDESEVAVKGIKSSYADISSLLAKDYAITPNKLLKVHSDFQKSIENYQQFLVKLQRLGDPEQIVVAKNILDWAWRDYAEFDLQLKMSKSVVERAETLLLIENVDSDHFKFVKEALASDIENLVRNENRLFYTLSNYNSTVIHQLELYLMWQFRQSLGLKPTPDIVKAINQLPDQSEKSNNYHYKKKDRPFVIAEMRAVLSENFISAGDEEFQNAKNSHYSEASTLRFLSFAIENNVSLQQELKKRKEKAESES